MIAEIILIPDGMGLDASKASAQYVARGLSSIGMKVREHISVCPDAGQFQQAVSTALSRSNVLVTLGGMGSQSNYLAKTVLSRGLGLALEENVAAVAGIREYCRRTGEPFNAATDNLLAMLPRGASAFPGSYGKIPGCAISSTKQHIIMLPEVQAEIAPMFNKYVTPYLGGSATTTITRTLRTYGVKEAAVSEALGDLMNYANPAVTIQREENEVLVKVAAHAETSQQAAALCTPVLRDIVSRLGDAAYGLDVDSIQAAVVDKLDRKELDIAVVEAGTGGILTRVISETPNGQDILRYTVFAETAEAKEKHLGIKQKLLKKRGNISEYAAVAAASAVREKANARLGVAVLANTGDEKSRKCPVGAVYIAVCDADNVYIKKLVVGDGGAEPDVIIDAALSRALNMIRLVADYNPEPYSAAIPLEQALNSDVGITEAEELGTDGTADEAEEHSGFWGRFLGNFIIRKSDKRGVKVRKVIFILALIVFLGSAGYVGYHYYNGYIAKKHADELSNMFMFGDMDNVDVSPDYPKNYSLKFAGLWNVNPDVVAFVSIPDTGVSYPVVQAKDNDYYLRRNFYGKSNNYGVPFMDYRDDVEEPSDNLIVYGHNMKDGQIFGELMYYNPKQYGSIGYYKEHPVIDCATVYNDESQYKIFSIFITNAYENQGPVFAYHDFIDASSDDDFMRFVDEVTKRSMVRTPVDVKKGDKLLTLSTCTYEFKDARLVIVARAVRNGEDSDVDVSLADLNPSPLMPDIWYKTFGGNKPVGASVTEIATEPAASSSSASVSVSSSSSSSRSSSSVSSSSQSQTVSDEVLALEAESRAASRRASEKAESERAASEKAASEKAASEKAASEKAASEKAASEKAASEKAASEAAEASRLEEERRLAEEQGGEGDNIFDTDPDELLEKIAIAGLSVDLNDSDTYLKSSKKSSPTVTVKIGSKTHKDADAIDIIPLIVQKEIGSNFEYEAIKAQAVAAYTFIIQANSTGSVPVVNLASKADDIVVDAVSEVLGEALYYKSKLAFTPYHATSGGSTEASSDVWGGSYPYLVPVDSSIDKKAANFKVNTVMSKEKVQKLISTKLGIEASGDPAEWFEVISYTEGGSNGEVAVCGETKSQITGSTITGRTLRESVLGLRSPHFDIKYSSKTKSFTFTTYGYGHGVGMSQTGANLYAKKGMDYREILEHYYPGTKIK